MVVMNYNWIQREYEAALTYDEFVLFGEKMDSQNGMDYDIVLDSITWNPATGVAKIKDRVKSFGSNLK